MSYALFRLSQMLLFLKKYRFAQARCYVSSKSVVSCKPDAVFPQKVSSRLSQMLCFIKKYRSA